MAVDDPTLRDHLAVERTKLANERTLLAYFRTALGMVIAGLTVIHFLDSPGHQATGWTAFGAGVLIAAWGAVRYLRIRAIIQREADQADGRRA
ncbi:MAG TPA: DUF202 domain-containing protein [Actinomycetota bacterium]|jgi:putative membrane protein